MSDYESQNGRFLADSVKDLFRHRGRWSDFLDNYQTAARDAVSDGKAGLKRIAPDVLRTIADERVLFAAWTRNAMRGGRSPGADGRTYSHYGHDEVWPLCKAVGRAIKEGTYRMGPEKVCAISKTSGPGNRNIVLLTLVDRMVQNAARMILRPLFDPLFYPTSFGFRPGLGQLKALACAERNAVRDDRFVWVCHDFRDAFGSVPIGRLMGLIRGYLPDPSLLDFLGRIIPSKKTNGLRQGGALAPDMLNFYAHHHVDRPLSDALPQLRWIRYADDLLMQCRFPDEATEADRTLRKILSPTGFSLKAATHEAIFDLRSGRELEFLGFTISLDGKKLRKRLPEHAWEQLRRKLSAAHTKEHASLRAEATIMGWLKARGPAFDFSEPEAACRKVIRTAERFGFEEVPDLPQLVRHWKTAQRRWKKLRKVR